jgi:hypothetical protein
VVVDEAHHAAAAAYRTVLARLGFLPMADASDKFDGVEAATFDDVEEMRAALTGGTRAPKDRLLIGVTATPNRSDAIGLGCVFQTIAYSYGLKQAIEDGYLVPIKPWVIETAESSTMCIRVRGSSNRTSSRTAVNTPTAQPARGRRVAGVRAGGADDRLYRRRPARARSRGRVPGRRASGQALSGRRLRGSRGQMLRQIQNGQLDGIANCMVLTEGTDLPIAGCILHAKPTKSATLYEQMTGRGLRPYPGKTQCVVLDLVDVARRHSLQTAPVLYGLPPGINTKGNELQKLADELEALREKIPNLDELLETKRYSLEELRDRATTFDVFTIPDLGAIASLVAMQWIRSGVDTFRVSYPWGDGTETLIVSPDVLGKFTVSLTLRPNVDETGRRPPARQRTLAAEIEGAGAALQVAERWVEADRRSVLKLKASDAPWRSRPASDKQIAYLEKLRIPIKPGMTMGEASNAIDMVKARAGR